MSNYLIRRMRTFEFTEQEWEDSFKEEYMDDRPVHLIEYIPSGRILETGLTMALAKQLVADFEEEDDFQDYCLSVELGDDNE